MLRLVGYILEYSGLIKIAVMSVRYKSNLNMNCSLLGCDTDIAEELLNSVFYPVRRK